MTPIARTSAALPLMLALACAAGPARATQRVQFGSPESPLHLEFAGEYRFQGTMFTDIPVTADGVGIDQPYVADQRLRGRFDISGRHFRVGTEWDLFSGQMFGPTWGIPGDVDERNRHARTIFQRDGFVPRRAAATFSWPAFTLEMGLVTSHWGLGMLANDGAHDPLFGRNDFGDRVVRLRATGKPLYLQQDHPLRHALHVTAAFDWVIADDTARFSERQLALQGIASVLYADARDRQLGIYAVYRHQRELDEDRTTQVVVIDAFGHLPIPLGTGPVLSLAFEGVLITGETDRSLTYGARRVMGVVSGGATGVATVHAPGDVMRVRIRGGLASGDPDPDDGLAGDFSFDRDFDVGMVLFDQLSGGAEAAAHAQLTDPTLSPPPDGVDALVTEGSFRRAMFVQPVFEYDPVHWLGFKVGGMLATSVVDWTQPYYTYRAGGDPRNHLDTAPEGRFLGAEVNWAVRLGGPVRPARPGSVEAAFLAQGGHLFVGPALAGPGPDSIHMWLLTGRLRW